MSKSFRKFVCAFFLVVLMAGISYANEYNFALVNRSGFTISKIFLRPTGIENWDREQYEVPGKFPVHVGDTIDILGENIGYKFWNMLIVFEDGRRWSYHNVDLSSIRHITVNVDGRALDETGKYHDFPRPRIRPAAKYRSRPCYSRARARFTSKTYRAVGPRRVRPARYSRPCYRYRRVAPKYRRFR